MTFFNFLNFFVIFYGNGSPAWLGTKFGTKIFFSLSRPISSRFGEKECWKVVFFFFFFFAIFSKFSSPGRVGTEFGTKIIFFLSQPISSRFVQKQHRNDVFQFFEFFSNFFLEIEAQLEQERNSGLNFFFFSYPASLNPFWTEIMPELSFLIF